MSLVVFDEQCHQLLAAGMVNLVKAPDKRAVEVEHPRPLPASIMTASKRELYRDLVAQFEALRAGEPDPDLPRQVAVASRPHVLMPPQSGKITPASRGRRDPRICRS